MDSGIFPVQVACQRSQAALFEEAQQAFLHGAIIQHLAAFARTRHDGDLFARGQGARVVDGVLQVDHAFFRGQEIVVVALPEPQGAKAQGVDAAHAHVAEARDHGRRALGRGGEKPAVEAVHALKLCGHALHLGVDGREDHFQGFHELEAVQVDEAFEDAVQVLGVAAAGRGDDAQGAGRAAQLLDGVDLAVVPQQGKGLGALGRGQGVGGVAAVAQGDEGLAQGFCRSG
jgi:hypothetical protein